MAVADMLMLMTAKQFGRLLASEPQELFELFAAAVLVVNDAPSKAHVHMQWCSITSSQPLH